MPHMKRRIVSILRAAELNEGEKIQILRQWEADSLAKERGATEGFTPIDGDDGEDLRAVEMALRKLGQEPVTIASAAL